MAKRKATPKQRAQLAKRVRRLSRAIRLEAWDSWNITPGEPPELRGYYARTGLPITLNELAVLKATPRHWLIRVLVRCITDDGERYIEEREIEARDVRINDLEPIYREARADALRAINPHHLVDVGWIARPLD